MEITETLIRSGGRLSLIVYEDGSIQATSMITSTSVLVPAADVDCLIRELQAVADSRRAPPYDHRQGRLGL